MGASDRAVGDLTLDARVRDLDAVVTHLGLDRFALGGVDIGAATAINYAARNRTRVSRLVLLSPWVSGAERFALSDLRVASGSDREWRPRVECFHERQTRIPTSWSRRHRRYGPVPFCTARGGCWSDRPRIRPHLTARGQARRNHDRYEPSGCARGRHDERLRRKGRHVRARRNRHLEHSEGRRSHSEGAQRNRIFPTWVYATHRTTGDTRRSASEGLARNNHEASLLPIEAVFGWTSTSDDFVRGVTASRPI